MLYNITIPNFIYFTVLYNVSMSLSITSYLTSLKVNGASDDTIRYYTSILNEAGEFKPLEVWSRDDADAFFLSLGGKNKKSSIEVKKLVLKNYFTWAKKLDITEHIKVKMPRNDLKREEILTVEDVNKMIEAIESHFYKALVAFLFESGCRISEALSVKVQDVQETDKGMIVTIPTKAGSNCRSCSCIYSAQYIRNHLSYSMPAKDEALFNIGKNQAWAMIKKIGEAAKINKPVSPNRFRHASAADMLWRGYNEDSIRKKHGLSPTSTVPARYKHIIDIPVKPPGDIKPAQRLEIADASLQMAKLSEENVELKEKVQMLEALMQEVCDRIDITANKAGKMKKNGNSKNFNRNLYKL